LIILRGNNVRLARMIRIARDRQKEAGS